MIRVRVKTLRFSRMAGRRYRMTNNFALRVFTLTLFISSVISSAAMTSPALAEYPEKPVTLVCWSSAGSGHDLMARMIAKVGEKYLGQPIVVVNKQGGSGKVAMNYVLNQKPDGHVLMTNTRSMVLSVPGSQRASHRR